MLSLETPTANLQNPIFFLLKQSSIFFIQIVHVAQEVILHIDMLKALYLYVQGKAKT